MAHHHAHNHNVSGKKLLWTIIFNSAITIAEFVGGLLSGYLALVADAVHNLSDVASLALAWLGVKGSQMPATKKSTYGYKRIEVITAFISAFSLVVIAIYIIMEAYDRYINPRPLTHPWLFMSVATIGLVGNVLSIWILHSEKGKSLNMKAAFLHMAYDALSSIAVIAGGIIILLTDLYIIDVFLSVIIALMIFWSSYLVIKEALLVFLEAVPENINFDEVSKAIASHKNVINVHDLHIWSLSSTDIALSCHIALSENDLGNGPAITNELGQLLCDRFGIGHSTIQVETELCHNANLLCNSEHPHGDQHHE